MLSQTCEYALRAMACLAISPDDLIPTSRLAKQTLVPPNYLAKVLQLLAQAKLITGRRGVGGGYQLARPAEEISLIDVVNAIDPVKRIKTCPLGLENHRSGLCALHRSVDAAAKQFIDTFSETRLSDLIVESDGLIPLCDMKPGGAESTGSISLSIEGEQSNPNDRTPGS